MLLGYHTNSLQNHRLDEGLQLLADHAYGAVAITPDTCHVDPAQTDDDALSRLRANLSQFRLLYGALYFVLLVCSILASPLLLLGTTRAAEVVVAVADDDVLFGGVVQYSDPGRSPV